MSYARKFEFATDLKFKPGTDLEALLYKIMRNAFFTAQKRKTTRWRHERAMGPCDESTDGEQFYALLFVDALQMMEKLSQKERQILKLAGPGGLDCNTIVELTGMKPRAVQNRLHSAREKMREYLLEEV